MAGFIEIFGIVSVVMLVLSFVWDAKTKYKECMLFYTIIGLIIVWLIVGFGYGMVLMRS